MFYYFFVPKKTALKWDLNDNE